MRVVSIDWSFIARSIDGWPVIDAWTGLETVLCDDARRSRPARSSTICFSVAATDATIIAASDCGRSDLPVAPVSHADSVRVSVRWLSARTSAGPCLSSCLAGPSSRMGTSTLGPNSASARCWACEDSVPGTVVIDGEREFEIPEAMSVERRDDDKGGDEGGGGTADGEAGEPVHDGLQR